MDIFGIFQALATLIIALLGVVVTFWPPKSGRHKIVLLSVFVVCWLAAIWLQQQERASLIGWERGDPAKPPYVNIVPFGDSHAIILVNEADLPAFDIGVRMFDPARYANLSNGREFLEAMKGDTNFHISSMAPNSTMQVGTLRLPSGDVQDFAFQISARSGSFFEHLKFRRVEGVWASAYKVTNFGEESSLIERASANFPRGPDAQIE